MTLKQELDAISKDCTTTQEIDYKIDLIYALECLDIIGNKLVNMVLIKHTNNAEEYNECMNRKSRFITEKEYDKLYKLIISEYLFEDLTPVE